MKRVAWLLVAQILAGCTPDTPGGSGFASPTPDPTPGLSPTSPAASPSPTPEPTPAPGTPPPHVTLSLADALFLIEGELEGDNLGTSLRRVSDVLGQDGRADWLFSAEGSDLGADNGGVVYVVPGPLQNTLYVANEKVRVVGDSASAHIGTAPIAADVDGDGTLDLLVDSLDDSRGADLGGVVGVFLGPLRGTRPFSEADFYLVGDTACGQFGRQIVSADINKDGWQDVVVAAPHGKNDDISGGDVYVFFGPITEEVQAEEANLHFGGTDRFSTFGTNLDVLDFDEDGELDLIVGDSTTQTFGSGALFVFRGPLRQNLTGDDADFVFFSQEVGALPMETLSVRGDFDGDGGRDVVVGGLVSAELGQIQGLVSVFLPPYQQEEPALNADTTLSSDVAFVGVEGVSAVTPLPLRAGADSLAIAIPNLPEPEPGAGRVYVFPQVPRGRYDLEWAPVHVEGTEEGDHLGQAIRVGEDVDGYGVPEVFISVPGYDEGRGVVAVFSGERILAGAGASP